MFTFPIVIGQRRVEQVIRKKGQALERTYQVYERRSVGLSPLNADGDDTPVADIDRARNRRATPVAASAKGVYWEARIPFLPANAPNRIKAQEPFWGEGEANIVVFPANAEPSADGLIVVVTLANRSQTRQTWFADFLGGIEVAPNGLAPEFLKIEKDAETGSPLLRHEKSPLTFALTARSSPFAQSGYTVKNSFLSDSSLRSLREADGRIQPPALYEATAKSEAPHWGLLRVDDVSLAPGEKRTITLCIGIGKDGEQAKDSATTLLGALDDILPDGKPREGGGLLSQARKAYEREAAARGGGVAFEGLVAQSLTNVVQTELRRVGVPSRESGDGAEGATYHPAAGGLIALGWSLMRPEHSAAQINAHLLSQLDPNRPLSKPVAVAPANIIALWELYQVSRDKGLLERAYPAAKHRYQELLAAARSTANPGLFAWSSASQRAQGLMTRPLLTRSAYKSFAPEISAYVIRSAKTLLKITEALELPDEERKGYQAEIDAATLSLNTQLWDALRGAYAPKANGQPPALEEADSIATLLPLIIGADALPEANRKSVLQILTSPELFWSPYGLRSLSKASFAYRPAVAGAGGVHYGVNWLIWKALLDIGEAETAGRLAQNLLSGYEAAHAICGGYPEWLNGETGAPQGARDYSGDSCVLGLLNAAYRTPGTFSAGFDVQLISPYYDKQQDRARCGFRASSASGAGVIIGVMGKPKANYHLQGTLSGSVTSDADGRVVVRVPKDSTVQSLEIVPE